MAQQSRFFKPVKQEEFGLLMSTLQANKDKDFVKRILSPDQAPKLRDPAGGYATHRMAWAEEDGKYYVYPTVMPDPQMPGKLIDYGPDQGFEEARKRGERIEFPTASAADWFSQNYKAAWGGRMNAPPD